jgi:hypothetical protein
VPLETELRIAAREPAGWQLLAGDQTIATATPAALPELTPLTPPTYDEAAAAARHFVGFKLPPPVVSKCFVCGAERDPGDALRIFPGALPGSDTVAAPWSPDASLAAVGDALQPEFVWAALDCPGYFAAFPAEEFAVLGEFSAQLKHPVRANEPHVVLGWPLGRDGRKRRAATALYDAKGVALAWAVATWIEVKS